MVLGYIRLFGNLTLRKHIVILLTTFGVPISVELVQGLIATGFCGSCVHFGWLALYFGWYQIAMLLFAWSEGEERATEDAKLTQIATSLSHRIDHIREEQRRDIAGLLSQMSSLDDWVTKIHQTLSEQGIDLPHRVRSGGGDGAIVKITGREAHVVTPPPSNLVRFRRKAKYLALRIWRILIRLFWGCRD